MYGYKFPSIKFTSCLNHWSGRARSWTDGSSSHDFPMLPEAGIWTFHDKCKGPARETSKRVGAMYSCRKKGGQRYNKYNAVINNDN